jgi:hypothetical protein
MKKVVITGLSIRKELLQRIEAERGDISRSRFLSRLVEDALGPDTNSLKKLPQGSRKVVAHEDLAVVQTKTTHRDKS